MSSALLKTAPVFQMPQRTLKVFCPASFLAINYASTLLMPLLKKSKEISVPLLVLKFTALWLLFDNVLKHHRMTFQLLLEGQSPPQVHLPAQQRLPW